MMGDAETTAGLADTSDERALDDGRLDDEAMLDLQDLDCDGPELRLRTD
jgi:hypothetical protein